MKEKKKGSCLMTVLKVFAVFIVIGVIASIFGGGGDEKPSNSNPQKTGEIESENNISDNDAQDDAEDESEAEEPSNEFHVGDVVETSDLKISFLSAEPYQSDNDFITPKDGNVFYRFEFEFENTGNTDKSISSLISWNCYADGYAMEQSWIGDDVLDATISPERKAKGAIYYEVPENAESIDIEYETNFWSQNKIVFIVK